METADILAALDEEIRRLEQAKTIIAGPLQDTTSSRLLRKKRHLSPEARAKIAAAQKARWAKAKKATK
jgi:hypothetical protein